MKDAIRHAVQVALEKEGAKDIDFVVEHPNDQTHGDYTTNAALVVAKTLGMSPHALANRLVDHLTGEITNVAEFSVAGPGFINMTLTRQYLTEQVYAAVEQGEMWGNNESARGQEILVEYTSPNLFKPLHIGNLVGNIIGESIARLLSASGATVRRLNYPSDIGLTVAKGVWGLQQSDADPRDISAIGEAYRYGAAAYESDSAAKQSIDKINRVLYEGGDHELDSLRAAGVATSKAHLDALCSILGTEFDAVITESEASSVGQHVVREHTGKVFAESNGAIVYEGERVGLHTRVFLNSQGLPTYEAKDVGNFVIKQQHYPNWDKSIVVTGSEQRTYFSVLFAALRELYPNIEKNSLEHIPTGFLTLTTGKMSSRKGNVLTGESLLEELAVAARERAVTADIEYSQEFAESIGVAALKYQILRSSLGVNIVFDKERALSFEGDSGPYLQYTHARLVSVINRALEKGITPASSTVPDQAYDVERVLLRFPEVVHRATTERAPHKLVGYATELASSFNSWYAMETIADTTDTMAPYKLLVSQAVQQTLANSLWLLGITAPRRM
jgi:arginyl-tRNA synthetase